MSTTNEDYPVNRSEIEGKLRSVSVRFRALEAHSEPISLVISRLISCFRGGNKLILCGNGGSAADSQHLAAEFMGRYLKERQPLPAISLTVDTSAITAIANDYGYQHVFSRQLRGIGRSGDVLIGISTSGHSANVLHAFQAAGPLGVTTVALTGADGGQLARIADFAVKVPATLTNEVQEMHIVVGHLICDQVERAVC